MVLWMTDHPRIGEPFLLFLKTVSAFFSHLMGVSGGVRRLVAFPWSRELDFKAAPETTHVPRAANWEPQEIRTLTRCAASRGNVDGIFSG
jgi:hypothetical protein